MATTSRTPTTTACETVKALATLVKIPVDHLSADVVRGVLAHGGTEVQDACEVFLATPRAFSDAVTLVTQPCMMALAQSNFAALKPFFLPLLSRAVGGGGGGGTGAAGGLGSMLAGGLGSVVSSFLKPSSEPSSSASRSTRRPHQPMRPPPAEDEVATTMPPTASSGGPAFCQSGLTEDEEESKAEDDNETSSLTSYTGSEDAEEEIHHWFFDIAELTERVRRHVWRETRFASTSVPADEKRVTILSQSWDDYTQATDTLLKLVLGHAILRGLYDAPYWLFITLYRLQCGGYRNIHDQCVIAFFLLQASLCDTRVTNDAFPGWPSAVLFIARVIASKPRVISKMCSWLETEDVSPYAPAFLDAHGVVHNIDGRRLTLPPPDN